MSPEQATAARGLVDQRTDVYSLAATLYEMLTLRPVFTAEDRALLLKQIVENDPVPPRKFNRSIPADLETILLKCLEKEPAQRYATAQSLADDLQRFLQSKPIAARPPGLANRAGKWARRNKPLVIATAVVVLFIGLAISALVVERIDRGAKATVHLNRGIEEIALRSGEARAKQDDLAAWSAAIAAAKRAEAIATTNPVADGLREHVENLLANLVREEAAARTRLAEAERDRLVLANFDAAKLKNTGPTTTADKKLFENSDAVVTGYAQAFRDYGIDVENLPAEIAARRICERPIRRELLLALLEWWLWSGGGRESQRDKLMHIAQDAAAAGNSWETRIVSAVARRDALELEKLGELLLSSGEAPGAFPVLAQCLISLEKLAVAERMLKGAHERHPNDFWTNHWLGRAYNKHRGDSEFAMEVAFQMAAVALRPDSPGAHTQLGNALSQAGRFEEAETSFRRAIDLDPNFAPAYRNLGFLCHRSLRIAEAISACRTAIDLRPDYGDAYEGLGAALGAQGRFEEGVAAFRKAIELDPGLWLARSNLGTSLAYLGQLDEAVSQLRKSVELHPGFPPAETALCAAIARQGNAEETIRAYHGLVQKFPDQPEFLNSLAWQLATSPDEKARDANEAMRLARRALELNPQFAACWNTYGAACYRTGRWHEAEHALRKSMELTGGGSGFDWFFTAMVHWQLGWKDDAAWWFDRGVEWMADRGRDDDEETGRLRAEAAALLEINDEGWSHYRRATNSFLQGKLDSAVSELQQVVESRREYPRAYSFMGKVLAGQGKLGDAVATYRTAIELRPDFAMAYNNLAELLARQGKFGDAISAYRQAIDLKFDFPEAHDNLAGLLVTCPDPQWRDPPEAVRLAERMVKLGPNLAGRWATLGIASYRAAEWQRAADAFKQALKLRSLNPYDHFFLAMSRWQLGEYDDCKELFDVAVESMDATRPDDIQLLAFRAEAAELLQINDEARPWCREARALLGQRKWEEAATAIRKAIEIRPDYPAAHELLGTILSVQGNWDEAIASFHSAIERKPGSTRPVNSLCRLYATRGKLTEEIATYRSAIERLPNSAELRNNLAWLLVTSTDQTLRDPADAVRLATKAVELAPTEGAYWNTVGVAHYRAGNWAAARAALQKSVDFTGGGSSADWLFLAMTCWQLGKSSDAREWLNKAKLGINPNQLDDELRQFLSEAQGLVRSRASADNNEVATGNATGNQNLNDAPSPNRTLSRGPPPVMFVQPYGDRP
jgi:tetratricopeptide (TPR) repeat protein